MKTILNLNRSNSTWLLDPRENFNDVFDPTGVPQGIGYQVSVEFNLIYRWHSLLSDREEAWVKEFYAEIFPGKDAGMLAMELDPAPLYHLPLKHLDT